MGKYTLQTDAYMSLISSIRHACLASGVRVKLNMIESSHLEPSMQSSTNEADQEQYQSAWNTLRSANGVVVPGGFGNRGIEGMVLACKYVRENKVPFLGICLGLQVAVIEYTRNILGKTSASSEEFDSQLTGRNRRTLSLTAVC